MTVQFSIAVQNARLDVIESTIGASPKLQIRSGAQPATCAAAASGSILAELTLPADWQANAAGGSKSLIGVWSVAATGTGIAAHYRLMDNAGVTCHEQGTVTGIGGGGDMTLNNTSVAAGQTVSVMSWTKTDGNP